MRFLTPVYSKLSKTSKLLRVQICLIINFPDLFYQLPQIVTLQISTTNQLPLVESHCALLQLVTTFTTFGISVGQAVIMKLILLDTENVISQCTCCWCYMYKGNIWNLLHTKTPTKTSSLKANRMKKGIGESRKPLSRKDSIDK